MSFIKKRILPCFAIALLIIAGFSTTTFAAEYRYQITVVVQNEGDFVDSTVDEWYKAGVLSDTYNHGPSKPFCKETHYVFTSTETNKAVVKFDKNCISICTADASGKITNEMEHKIKINFKGTAGIDHITFNNTLVGDAMAWSRDMADGTAATYPKVDFGSSVVVDESVKQEMGVSAGLYEAEVFCFTSATAGLDDGSSSVAASASPATGDFGFELYAAGLVSMLVLTVFVIRARRKEN